MKFTLDGFSQEKALELGLDSTDLRLLRYFVDFKDSGTMATEIVDGNVFWWVNYQKLVDALPILSLQKRAVMKRFKGMADKKVLKSHTKKAGGTFSYFGIGERYIELIDSTVCIEKHRGVPQKAQGCASKSTGGVLQKAQQNINLLKDSSIKYIYIYSEIINYLNEKLGSNYKATTKSNITLIKARLEDGFTVDDFKKVIDIKYTDWKNTQFEQYLRPQTLFGTKFESYLNQGGNKDGDSRKDKQNSSSSKREPDFSRFS